MPHKLEHAEVPMNYVIEFGNAVRKKWMVLLIVFETADAFDRVLGRVRGSVLKGRHHWPPLLIVIRLRQCDQRTAIRSPAGTLGKRMPR
jgi:hypothetical protein